MHKNNGSVEDKTHNRQKTNPYNHAKECSPDDIEGVPASTHRLRLSQLSVGLLGETYVAENLGAVQEMQVIHHHDEVAAYHLVSHRARAKARRCASTERGKQFTRYAERGEGGRGRGRDI